MKYSYHEMYNVKFIIINRDSIEIKNILNFIKLKGVDVLVVQDNHDDEVSFKLYSTDNISKNFDVLDKIEWFSKNLFAINELKEKIDNNFEDTIKLLEKRNAVIENGR